MSNKIIFNITFKVEKDVEQDWLFDLENNLLSLVVDGQHILVAQVNQLILETEEEENTYAVQFTYATEEIFNAMKLPSMDKFLSAMDKKYKGKYVYFATKLKMLYTHGIVQNPEISLN